MTFNQLYKVFFSLRKSRFVIITGPESSGKSTLTQALAHRFNLHTVEEAARWYLPGLNRDYNYNDLIDISRYQAMDLLNNRYGSSSLVVVDTWLVVMRIWMEVRFGKCEAWIKTLPSIYKEFTYLLCAPDLPWEYDPLRENPDDRWELFELYKEVLESLGVSYTIIHGMEKEQRLAIASEVLTSI